MVFRLVIHLRMSFSSKHLFILIASLSWMEVNFLNQNSCMLWRPGVFQFGNFLGVTLIASMWIFTFRLSSSFCNSFFISFIYSAFCYDPSIPIFCSKIVLPPLHLVAGLSLHFLSLHADRIFFRCFEMSYFVCIVWSCHGIFLISLL